MALTQSNLEASFTAQFSTRPDTVTLAAIKWAIAYSDFAANAECSLSEPDNDIDLPIPSSNIILLISKILLVFQGITGASTFDLANGYVEAVKAFWVGDGVTSFPLEFGSPGTPGATKIDPAPTNFPWTPVWVANFQGIFDNTDWLGYTSTDRMEDYYQILFLLTLNAKTLLGTFIH